MGISQLQGSPWHIEYPRRRINEDNDFIFRKRKDKKSRTKRTRQVRIELSPGEFYFVEDPSSGINGQKVIFIERCENNLKVKLGERIYIVNHLRKITSEATKENIEPPTNIKNTVPDTESAPAPQNAIRVFTKYKDKSVKTEIQTLSGVDFKTYIKLNRNGLTKGDSLIINLSAYKDWNAYYEEKTPQGILVKLTKGNKQRFCIFQEKYIQKK